MKKYLLIPLFLFTVAFAQEVAVPTQLKLYLEKHQGSDELMQLYIKGDAREVTSYVLNHGGTIRHQVSGYIAINLPVNEVEGLCKQTFVTEIPYRYSQPQALADSMLVNNNVPSVHNGDSPLLQAFTGKDVIVGIIDTGLDFTHGDFIDSLGNTKVLWLWDQKYAVGSNTPLPFGYGQEWDSAAINSAFCPHEDSAFIYYGHGTSVAANAAGTGLATGNYKGVAFESDIIAVASDFYASDWYGSIADAVAYIFRKADSIGKPCVINLSLGAYAGSHDAKDPASLFIDSLITEHGGRAMCAAAGNAGHIAFHVGIDVTADTNFTWMEYQNNILGLGQQGFYQEIWSDTALFNNVAYSLAADSLSPNFTRQDVTPFHSVADNLGTTITDTLLNGTDTIAFVDFTLSLLGDRYRLEIYAYGTTATLQEYNMGIQFTGNGRADMWGVSWEGLSWLTSTGLPTVGDFPPIAYYVIPDSNQTMVDMTQCSDQVITVANYQNRETYIDLDLVTQSVTGTGTGTIVKTSSWGPTRDNRTKPTIGSPGLFCMAAATVEFIQWQWLNEPWKVDADSLHTRGAGTSVASPSIAGICALYLQKCPNATNIEIMNAITGNSVIDANTGSVPNNRWGYGKADAMATLVSSNFSVSLSTDVFCCGGDSVLISAPAGYAVYDWNNGDSTQNIYVTSDGNYSAVITDSSGCIGYSDTVNVLVTDVIEESELLYAVYPNPANQELTLVPAVTGVFELQLSDIIGKTVLKERISLTAGIPHTLTVGEFERGTYLLSVSGKELSTTSWLIELY